ncbi:hypothetical protein [Variovorax sp. JS1663]|uniref:hypothetical protein n=1 Tax=Variovorax sp. JS1663 TaxID=1851577 RepID=UPI000B347054|nr:hypothetical protein [Variovorax sp. JS1663]
MSSAADLLSRHLFGRIPVAPTAPADSSCTIRSMDGLPPVRRQRPGLHRHPATEITPAMRSLNCPSVRGAGVPEPGTQMKPEIAALWADALESGKYKRGARRLKDRLGRHSAVGVLCEVHRSLHPAMRDLQPEGASYLGESALLPRVVLAWAGLDLFASQGPEIAIKSKLTRQWRSFAVDVHDFMGASWPEIARAMRSQI